MNVQEHYMPHKFFRELGGLSNYEIEQMAVKYDYARSSDKGIPIFGMIRALNEDRKKLAEAFGSNLSDDVEGAKLEYELKEENILAKRILNQAKLGILVPKTEAEERIKKVLRSVINVIKNAIKNIAPRLINILNQRDVEIIITESWNDAIKQLEDNSIVISWEADGSSKLLQTRLADIKGEDPEFVEVIENRQHEKESHEKEN